MLPAGSFSGSTFVSRHVARSPELSVFTISTAPLTLCTRRARRETDV